MRKSNLTLVLLFALMTQSFGANAEVDPGDQYVVGIFNDKKRNMIEKGLITKDEINAIELKTEEILQTFAEAFAAGDEAAIKKGQEDFAKILERWGQLTDLLENHPVP
ncbi:MAG: hypothetical protein WCG04_00935 [Alphaproteobacteria bacterium]